MAPQLRIQQVNIVSTPKPVRSILVPINSNALFNGQIDLAINWVAGPHYSDQVREVLPILHEGETFIAQRGQSRHLGNFDDVIYVVDNQRKSLQTIVLNGLRAAEDAGHAFIAMSAMRTGNHQAKVACDLEETVRQLKQGFQDFSTWYPQSKLDITLALLRHGEYVRRFRVYFYRN